MQENENERQFEQALEYYAQRKDTGGQELLIALLRETQELFGCVCPESQERIAQAMAQPLSVISALVRRLPYLRESFARHRVIVCSGPRCCAKNGGKVLSAVEQILKIQPGQATPDGKFALSTQNCLKKCGTSPNIRIDEDDYPNVDLAKLSEIFQKYS